MIYEVIPVSAKYGNGVDDVKEWILSKLPLGLSYYPKAYIALNDIDAAVDSFKKALVLEPNDGGIKELAAANKKIADRRNQEKKAYSRMFQ